VALAYFRDTLRTAMPLPEGITSVFFDAGGTLIHAEPSPGDVYAAVGRRFGSRVDAAEARRRFRAAFQRRRQPDDLSTSEAAEDAFWRGVVAEVLDDVTDFESCYRELFAYFGRPEAWRTDPQAAAVLKELTERGLLIGVCSNFDARLHGIIAGLPELQALRRVVVSSEVGWRKPAAAFFAELSRVAGPPQRLLIVGDDPVNDYQGARAAGMAARLLDPAGRHAGPDRITALADLLG
jgi:putative hydrolase of the HAD superfamily